MEKGVFERIYDSINYSLNNLYVNNDDNKMSNNKQSMKLYTEEQVKQMIEKSRETGLTADYLILANKGIELPSNEEIHDKSIKYYTNITASFYFELGAKWMRDKIQGGNK